MAVGPGVRWSSRLVVTWVGTLVLGAACAGDTPRGEDALAGPQSRNPGISGDHPAAPGAGTANERNDDDECESCGIGPPPTPRGAQCRGVIPHELYTVTLHEPRSSLANTASLLASSYPLPTSDSGPTSGCEVPPRATLGIGASTPVELSAHTETRRNAVYTVRAENLANEAGDVPCPAAAQRIGIMVATVGPIETPGTTSRTGGLRGEDSADPFSACGGMVQRTLAVTLPNGEAASVFRAVEVRRSHELTLFHQPPSPGPSTPDASSWQAATLDLSDYESVFLYPALECDEVCPLTDGQGNYVDEARRPLDEEVSSRRRYGYVWLVDGEPHTPEPDLGPR